MTAPRTTGADEHARAAGAVRLPASAAACRSAVATSGGGDRGAAIGQGFTWLATWSLRFVLVAAAAVVLGLLVGRLWSVVLPVLLAPAARQRALAADRLAAPARARARPGRLRWCC